MTISEFLQALRAIRDQFDWALVPDMGQYAERRSTPRYHIRGVPASDRSLSLDPLHALCYVKTGTVFQAEARVDIGKVLGMATSDVDDIATVSSDCTWRATDRGRAPVARLLGLRLEVLETVGLGALAEEMPPGSEQERRANH